MKKLLKLALIIGGISAVAKLVAARKAEWQGLSEPQVREKLETKMPGRMPAEKRSEVADMVVSKMRGRGMLVEEEAATNLEVDLATDGGEPQAAEADTTEDVEESIESV